MFLYYPWQNCSKALKFCDIIAYTSTVINVPIILNIYAFTANNH